MSRMRSRIAHEAYTDTSIPGGGKGCKSRKEERSFLREISKHALVIKFCYNENLTETLVDDLNKSPLRVLPVSTCIPVHGRI